MNSEELLLRAAEERHAIVEKYRKGRHGGADIPAWEEPSYDVYHQLDRYGFIQDEKNQEVVSPKEIELNEQRVKKWIKMFHNWDKLGADKLRKRVYKGIPDKCRSTAWMLLLNVGKYQSHQMGHKNPSASDRSKLEQSNQKFKERRKKYEEMRELAWKYSPDIRQIDLDVNRTYREHIMFRDRYSSKQQELFNVLAAYSVYNMEIGYCQGMSQIVALLLMYLDEEQTFWALSTLVSDTKYSMHGFFIPGFPKLLRFQEHHDKIMNKFLPKLKKHLDKNSVDTGIYTLKWFFQCFLDRIPFKLTLRVWDIYLLEGESIMSAMAYNLLKMHQRQLIKLSMDDILHFIQVKLEKQYQFTEDATIESLQKCLDELKRYKLDHAGKPSPIELPKTPLGIFKPDAFTTSFEQKIGRRTSEFSSTEKDTQETVISRRDTAVRLASLPDRNSSIGTDANSRSQLVERMNDVNILKWFRKKNGDIFRMRDHFYGLFQVLEEVSGSDSTVVSAEDDICVNDQSARNSDCFSDLETSNSEDSKSQDLEEDVNSKSRGEMNVMSKKKTFVEIGFYFLYNFPEHFTHIQMRYKVCEILILLIVIVIFFRVYFIPLFYRQRGSQSKVTSSELIKSY